MKKDFFVLDREERRIKINFFFYLIDLVWLFILFLGIMGIDLSSNYC